MDKRDIIITITTSLLTTLIGAGGGIMVANAVNQEYHSQDVELTIERCQEDGLSDCHNEPVYSGLVLVDNQITGRRYDALDK